MIIIFDKPCHASDAVFLFALKAFRFMFSFCSFSLSPFLLLA